MSAYPTSLPSAEIANIVSIVRGGQVSEKMSDFARDLWWVQGYAQKLILDGGSFFPFSAEAPEGFDAIAALESVNAAGEGITTQTAIPWGQILLWALNELITLLKTPS